MKTKGDKGMAMLAHLLGILTGFIGPLVMFFVMRESKDKLVTENVRHSLNFQLSMLIYMLVAMLLMMVLIGFVLAPVLGVFALVVEIIGSVKAYGGEIYTYPLEIRFLK